MQFREHRGSLEESLKTTVVLKGDYLSLIAHLAQIHQDFPAIVKRLADEAIAVQPYPDPRCWPNQHIVTYGNGEGVLGMIDGPLPTFYPELCQRYRRMAVDALEGRSASNHSLPSEFQASHLMVMLEQLQFSPMAQQSLSKKHRWLGFVQAACIAQGWTDVQTERDHTRDIFNGA